MSESENEQQSGDGTGISDDQLPEDLQPSEDNPLAEGLSEEDDVDRDDLDMLGGRTPDESDESEGDAESADDGESGGEDADD